MMWSLRINAVKINFLRTRKVGILRTANVTLQKRLFADNQKENLSYRLPRRTCLYVPGDSEKKLSKSVNFNADCLVYDCEDGVALNKKEEARNTIKKHIERLAPNIDHIAVRINAVDSGFAEDDLKVLFSGEAYPSTIFLPKVESALDIDWFTEKLGHFLKEKKSKEKKGKEKDKENAMEDKKIKLVIYIESARSLLDLKDIISRGIELSEFEVFNLEGVVFGSDDYCASIGANRSKGAQEVLMARQQIVTVAKAFNLQAIDIVYIDYKDLEGLRKQSIEGANMGYTGKQVIHPSQLPVVEEAFTPSQLRIEWAKELMKRFEEHQASGTGAFVFEGQMIDKPLLRQARNILETVNIRRVY